METVGELIEFIIDVLGEAGITLAPSDNTGTERALVADHQWTQSPHPVTLAQQNILISHFLSREPTGEWNIAVARWLDGTIPSQLIADTIQEIASEHSALRTTFRQLGPQSFEQSVRELPPHTFLNSPHRPTERHCFWHALK